MAQTFAPTATYGSNAVKNRVRMGGDLGTNQYFYKTNAKTGTVEINRYETDKSGKVTETKIGKVPQGGTFIPDSDNANNAELKHFNNPQNIGRVRAQALQVARREWDGKTQPSPQQAIYGTNSGNAAYTPAGSKTVDESIKGTQTTGSGGYGRSKGRSRYKNLARDAIRLGAQAGANNLLKRASALAGGGSSVMVYPSALRQSGDGQDYLKIEELEWAPKKKTGYKWEARRSPAGKAISTIVLPIPGGISDTNSVSWGGDKMDPAQTALANLALTGIEKGFSAATDELQTMASSAGGKDKKQVSDAISKGIAGMASGTGAQLLTRTTGQVLNPNMELLFKEPSLRPFNFTWKLAARNEDEADAIIKIIRTFKKGMAAQTVGENLFLKSPHTWKLTYMNGGSPHPYLNNFKECAMNSITTQYTPDGNYATFETGHMTSYSINIAFTELEPVFSSDYADDDGIGY